MGLSCKPVGKFESTMRKLENQLVKDKVARKERVDQRKGNKKIK